MAIRKCNPITPGTRHKLLSKFDDITTDKPHKPLLRSIKKSGGRNADGKMTMRYRGGGHKRRYRLIDFNRDKHMVATVLTVEYDPNRSAHIALVLYSDGERRYIIAPKGLKVGQEIRSGVGSPIKPGNTLPLRNIPLGSQVHCIEMRPQKGAQIARSAGASVQLVAREGAYATLRLRSGEMRKVLSECRATIGEVSNAEHALRSLGKAGASRWAGKRPTVRGVVMNPVDHPMGGGEGRSSGGRQPCTPWGVPTKGYRTRSNKRTDKYIVKRRSKKK